MPVRNDSIILPDGRRLAYNEYGDPAGRPVLYSHGCPGSRLDIELSRLDFLRITGVRIIAVDRPGIGGSDRKPNRTLLDWPADVAALADSLGLPRFHLLAVSGGAPYAAACMYALSERVAGAALVCPLFQLESPDAERCMALRHRLILQTARKTPVFLAWICRLLGLMVRYMPAPALAFIAGAASPADREVLTHPVLRQAVIRSFQEAIRDSVDGVVQDLLLYVRPWGFDVHALKTRVDLWQGMDDRTVPEAMGRLWARALGNCTAHFLPREGHFSLPARYLEEILHNLMKK